MLQRILGFALKLSRKNCDYWFRQPKWESVVVCWVSKLAAKTNGEMLWSSNCKDCNQGEARPLQVSRLKTGTPDPQPTTPVSAPHSPVNSPLCRSRVRLCASQCVRGRRDSPANTVCANREIRAKDYCGTTLYKHRNREMHHQGWWGFGYRLPLNSGPRWASCS